MKKQHLTILLVGYCFFNQIVQIKKRTHSDDYLLFTLSLNKDNRNQLILNIFLD